MIEPLRAEWDNTQAATLILANENKLDAARAQLHEFHHRLCRVRVLDPACGTANFLYVTLEHLKRLEGEVLDLLDQLGDTQGRLDTEGLSVDPHQFLGLELNPRAAAIAELVLWIGYLQWHYRTRGNVRPPEPVLRDFKNIECRDAVLAHDGSTPKVDANGQPITRWDGMTMKTHPVTGEQVPDENARLAVLRYENPRPASWPEADFVVGNPPFIGKLNMRAALGDGYVEALRGAWPEVPDSADLVMFWWHHAAALVAAGKLQRFGFITTNSVTMTYNRRIVQHALDAGVHLAFAIPDHPWADGSDVAGVRIAMTVGMAGCGSGTLLTVTNEHSMGGEGLDVSFVECNGLIHADLTIGANVAAALPLRANVNVSAFGVIPHGAGFLVTQTQGVALDKGALLRPYRNGKDFTDKPRDVKVIDTYTITETELRTRYPATWQWLHDRVKPERDQNPRKVRRENWWLFGENQPRMRRALEGLSRYVATAVVAKHRVFAFLDKEILADQKLLVVATDDAMVLGFLSSRVHVCWALAAGGTLEDRPVYNNSRCFETFPFPDATPDQQTRIRDLAEQIDAHRKRVLADHAELTLTGLYNVLVKISAADTALNAKEKLAHEKGLVAVLKSLHDDLDAAVLDAYGWPDQPDDAILLERLVALNTQRRAEEAQGHIRWLRPAFQNPQAQSPLVGADLAAMDSSTPIYNEIAAKSAPTQTALSPWPATLPEQLAAVAKALSDAPGPQSATQLAANFTGKGKWKSRLPDLLAALAALGRAHGLDDGRWIG